MYKRLAFEIAGIAPLLVHNGQLADPLNEFSVKLSAVSRKRKKTESDHEEMSRIEWFGGLYLNEDRSPVIPGVNIEAMLTDAGKKERLGEAFKAGIISEGFWPIQFDGPKTPEKMFDSGKFTDRRGAKLNGKITIFRTRPIFHTWSLKFDVDYLDDVLNESQVRTAVTTAGRIIGLGDYTPRYGRFEVTN